MCFQVEWEPNIRIPSQDLAEDPTWWMREVGNDKKLFPVTDIM